MSNFDEPDRRSGANRRKVWSPKASEQRSGFDRREGGRGPGAAYRRALQRFGKDSLAFRTVLATIVVFNFLDLILTARPLGRGAEEANPVMRTLFWAHPLTAALVKLGVVAAVVLMLQRLRRFHSALSVTFTLLIGFTALMFYHAAFAVGWLG